VGKSRQTRPAATGGGSGEEASTLTSASAPELSGPMTPEAAFALGSAYGNDFVQAMASTVQRKEATPSALARIGAVGGFQEEELHHAVLTVFGEISAAVHDGLQSEARAVASTIFNRKTGISDARASSSSTLAALEEARTEYRAALDAYEDLAKAPSRWRRELGGQEAYDLALSEAIKRYEEAKRQLGKCQKAANAASSDKIAQESYVHEGARGGRITLTEIVTNPGQYLGFAKGLADYEGFAGMSEPDRRRNAQRWAAAVAAVTELAAGGIPESFVEFRSNRDGRRRLSSGETRIGGNDFW
jgi:hypothetical protein